MVTDGQKMTALTYAPLPESVAQKGTGSIKQCSSVGVDPR